jgi:hypothetical protein
MAGPKGIASQCGTIDTASGEIHATGQVGLDDRMTRRIDDQTKPPTCPAADRFPEALMTGCYSLLAGPAFQDETHRRRTLQDYITYRTRENRGVAKKINPAVSPQSLLSSTFGYVWCIYILKLNLLPHSPPLRLRRYTPPQRSRRPLS